MKLVTDPKDLTPGIAEAFDKLDKFLLAENKHLVAFDDGDDIHIALGLGYKPSGDPTEARPEDGESEPEPKSKKSKSKK